MRIATLKIVSRPLSLDLAGMTFIIHATLVAKPEYAREVEQREYWMRGAVSLPP